MSSAGESSSEAAPVRHRKDCQRTAQIIKDKAAAGRWYVAFSKEQSGNLGRGIRLEYDTGIALVVTSGKRDASGIDLATRGLAEALADMAAHEGVMGGVVAYDCMFRFQSMNDEEILAARAKRAAASRQGDGGGGGGGGDAGRSRARRTSQKREEPRARPSEKPREAQSNKQGDAKAGGSDHTREPAQSSGRGEVPNVDDINRFRRERSGGVGQPSRDDAYYHQEEGGSRNDGGNPVDWTNRIEVLSAKELSRHMADLTRRIGDVLRGDQAPSDLRDVERLHGRGSQGLRYDQLPRDPRDLDRPSRSGSARNPDRHGRSAHHSRRRRRDDPLWPGNNSPWPGFE